MYGGSHLPCLEEDLEIFLSNSTSQAKYSRNPIKLSPLWEMNVGRLTGAGCLIEVKTMEKPSLGL